MANLIFLDDEAIFREECSDRLRSDGHRVDEAATLAECRLKLSTSSYDVAILDRTLPDGDGLELLAEIAALPYPMRVVVLSAKNSPHDKAGGLTGGADYYLGKPVSLELLSAVVATQTRRTGFADGHRLSWVLNSSHWTLKPPSAPQGDEGVKLSAQDYIVLRTLVEGCGQPVTRRQLVAALGKRYLDYDQRRMDTQMRRLRRKVESQYGIDLPVKTIHSLGYVFVADVEVR